MCEYLAQTSTESKSRIWVTTPLLLPVLSILTQAAGSKSHRSRLHQLYNRLAALTASVRALHLVSPDTEGSWSG